MSKKNRREPVPAPPSPSLLPQALWIGGLLWLLLLCVKFYQVQPFPFTILLSILFPPGFSPVPSASVLAGYVAAIFWAGTFLLAALFVGRVVFSRFIQSTASSMEALVLAGGLGYGLLSYLTLALAAGGFIGTGFLKGLILALAVSSVVWFLRSPDRDLAMGVWREKKAILFSSGLRFYLSVLLLFIFATDIVMAFVPELFYDALVYHLGVPNYYLNEGRLASLNVMHAKFPFTVQMLHLIGLALKDEMVTKLTHVFTLVLISGGMMALGLRFKKPLWGLVAALVFCAIPTVQLNVITSGVDVAASLFAFLGAYSMLVFLEEPEEALPWLVLSAVFTGFALGSKYTAAPVAAVLGLVLLIKSFIQKKPVRKIVKQALVYGVTTILFLSPWFIKNWMDVGNPVYPFLSNLFGGESMEPWRYDILRGENYGLPLKTVKDFFLVYWKLSLSERSSLSFMGPMLIGVIPFCLYGFFNEKPAPWLKTLLWMSVLFVPMALFETRLTRYWMPGVTFVTLMLSFGVAELLDEKSFLKKISVLLVLSLTLLFQISWVYLIIRGSYGPGDVLTGRISRDAYVSVYHSGMNPNPSVPMYRYMETVLGKGDKVLLVGDEKAYPLHVRHVYSGVYDRGPLVRAAESSQTPEEMAKKLTDSGLTHLMVNLYESNRLAGYGIYNFSPHAFGVFCGFWEGNVELQHVENAPLTQGYTNPLLLLKILPAGRAPGTLPVQNPFLQFYEKNELARIGIESPEKLADFYRAQVKNWPQVQLFRIRLQELEKTKDINSFTQPSPHK